MRSHSVWKWVIVTNVLFHFLTVNVSRNLGKKMPLLKLRDEGPGTICYVLKACIV